MIMIDIHLFVKYIRYECIAKIFTRLYQNTKKSSEFLNSIINCVKGCNEFFHRINQSPKILISTIARFCSTYKSTSVVPRQFGILLYKV